MPKSFGDVLSIFGNNPGSARNERPNIYKVHVSAGRVSRATGFIVKDATIKQLDAYLLGGAIDRLHTGSKYVHAVTEPLVDLAEKLDPSLKRFRNETEQQEMKEAEEEKKPLLADKEFKHEGPLRSVLTPVHNNSALHPTNGFYRQHHEAVHVAHIGFDSSTYHTAGHSSSTEIHAAFG